MSPRKPTWDEKIENFFRKLKKMHHDMPIEYHLDITDYEEDESPFNKKDRIFR